MGQLFQSYEFWLMVLLPVAAIIGEAVPSLKDSVHNLIPPLAAVIVAVIASLRARPAIEAYAENQRAQAQVAAANVRSRNG